MTYKQCSRPLDTEQKSKQDVWNQKSNNVQDKLECTNDDIASCQGWNRLRVKVTALYVTKNEVSEYIGKGFMRNYQTLNKKY